MTDPDTRLETIESQLAFQEDLLQQLNEALVAQQSRIDQLQAMLRMLSAQLQTGDDDAADLPEPPPPHY